MKVSGYLRVLPAFSLLLAIALFAPAAAQTPTMAPPAPLTLVPTEHVWASTEVASGRDGFPYLYAFHITGDKAGAGRTEYTIADLARVAVSKHVGIMVFGEGSGMANANGLVPIRTYSLGKVMAVLHPEWPPADPTIDISLHPGDHIQRANAADAILPVELRDAIAEFMQKTDHVAVPKIATMIVQTADGKRKPGILVSPNLARDGFATEADWGTALGRIEWFLPPTVIAIRPPAEPSRFATLFAPVEPLVAK
jgi:hypothetical protein